MNTQYFHYQNSSISKTAKIIIIFVLLIITNLSDKSALGDRAAINLKLIRSDCGTVNVSRWRRTNPYSSMKPLIGLIGIINHLIR